MGRFFEQQENDKTLQLVGGFLVLLLSACGGGGDGGNSLAAAGDKSVAARTTPLPVNDPTCPQGGILVETGIDENGNGLLDSNEVDSSQKVCNGLNGSNGVDGSNGLNSLVALSDEPVGSNCPYGGVRIDSGLDANNNATLDASEISQTRFVCNRIDSAIGWQQPELLEFQSGQVSSPRVVSDGVGSGWAVWIQWDGSMNRVYARHYEAGSGWGAVDLIDAGGSSAFDARIAVGGGQTMAVWAQNLGGKRVIKASHYQLGTGWSTPQQVSNSGASGSASQPEVALDAAGNAVAVWRELKAGGGYSLWGSSYDAQTGAWSTAAQLDNGAGDVVRVGLAMNGSEADVIWQQDQGGATATTPATIWASHYQPGTGWDVAMRLDGGSSAFEPRIAGVPGGVVAVWREERIGGSFEVWSRSRDVSGWGAPVKLSSAGTAGSVIHPDIASGPSGERIAVWQQTDRSASGFQTSNIWANHYDPATGWGVAQRIETSNAGAATYPRVSMDDQGTAIAVWIQSDGYRNNILANRFVPGAGWGLAERVETDDADNAGQSLNTIVGAWFVPPEVAMDGSGNALAVWGQKDAAGVVNLMANRWAAP